MNSGENQTTALVPAEQSRLPVATPEKKEGYWGRISACYKRVSRVLLVASLLFVVLFMLLFSRVFTYDSLFSFFKDLQTVSSFIPSDYDTVYATYEKGDHTALSYRGGVAFVNGGGVEIYSPNGRRLTDIALDYEAPRAVASRKYLIAYDQGGKDFTVTNSYAALHMGKTDFAILGAAISDSGHFALITEADRTNPEEGNILSYVLLYDNNFNLIQEIKRVTATVGVSVSDNGKRLACFGATAENGQVRACLDVYRIGRSKEAEQSFVFDGEMPLSVGFTDNKNIVCLTDQNLRCCEIDGDLDACIAIEGALVGFKVDQNGALLVIETDPVTATQRVLALESSGETAYDGQFIGDIAAVAMGDGELFLLSGETVTRIDPDGNVSKAISVEAGATELFVVDDKQIRVIYPAKAIYVSFENS